MNTEQLHWFKSSHSGGEGGYCVEVAPSPTTVHVRDSKLSEGPHVTLPPASWAVFVSYARSLPVE